MKSFWYFIRWSGFSALMVLLVLSSGGSRAQDDASQAPLVQAQEIRTQLKKLSGQLARLRQTSTQSDHQLSVQVQGVHKQIEQLERRQAELIERLQTLQTHHEKNQTDHRQHSQQLVHVLWSLAVLGGLMLLVLWRLWLPRTPKPETQAPPSAGLHSPAKQPDLAVQPMASGDSSEPAPQPLSKPVLEGVSAAVNVAPRVAPSPVDLPFPILTAPADLAVPVTDLSSTEQVLAQGLQGFMQPVPFK